MVTAIRVNSPLSFKLQETRLLLSGLCRPVVQCSRRFFTHFVLGSQVLLFRICPNTQIGYRHFQSCASREWSCSLKSDVLKQNKRSSGSFNLCPGFSSISTCLGATNGLEPRDNCPVQRLSRFILRQKSAWLLEGVEGKWNVPADAWLAMNLKVCETLCNKA